MVMFHAARSILFFDGFREKSHACVARYLEEKYVKTGKFDKKWIELLDHSREVRHNDQYDLRLIAGRNLDPYLEAALLSTIFEKSIDFFRL